MNAMTTKNAKTILFASLIAAMILPFSMMNYAEAIDEETIKLAEQGKKMIEKIDKIEDKLAQVDLSDKEREKLEANLEKLEADLVPILETLNSQGLYTPEQFEEVREELITSDPPVTSTLSCGTCDPVVFFRAGYDWQILGFWKGTEVEQHYWKVTTTGDVSETDPEPHDTNIIDWIQPFTQLFRDGGNYAEVTWNMGLISSSNHQYKTYDARNMWIQSTSMANPDEVKESKYYQFGKDDKVRTTLIVDQLG